MARVLVLTLVFPPDGVSTAVIMGELAVDLKAAGHDVTVVTTVPHYNRDVAAESAQPLVSAFAPFVYRSDFKGVPVLHVAMPRKGPKVLPRLLAWVQFHILSFIVTLARVRRIEVIIAPSPPLTIGLCAWLIGKIYRAPYVYVVQEIYPDIAITLGALKSRWLIALLFALERFVYTKAAAITVIAEHMRCRLVEKSVPAEKVQVVPNFVDIDDIRPLPKDNDFSRRHRLDRSFVVSYAGNMGPAQGIETILDAATLLRDLPDLKFLLVGEGGLRDQVEATKRERHLANVIILPHEPYATVPQIYASSDVCLVPLAANTGTHAVPSKSYRIMAAARPVLACADADSDLAALIGESGAGVVVPPGQAHALADAILEAMRDRDALAAMGASGRAFVVAHYARTAVSAKYEALVSAIASGNARSDIDSG